VAAIHSRKQQEITRGQIRRVRSEGDHSHIFGGQKTAAVAKRRKTEPCHGVPAIVREVFGELAPSDVAKISGSNAVCPFDLQKQIRGEFSSQQGVPLVTHS